METSANDPRTKCETHARLDVFPLEMADVHPSNWMSGPKQYIPSLKYVLEL